MCVLSLWCSQRSACDIRLYMCSFIQSIKFNDNASKSHASGKKNANDQWQYSTCSSTTFTISITICCVVFPSRLHESNLCVGTQCRQFQKRFRQTRKHFHYSVCGRFSVPPLYRLLWFGLSPHIFKKQSDWSVRKNLVEFIWWLIKHREQKESLKNLFIVYLAEKRWCPFYIITRWVHRVGRFCCSAECSISTSICVSSTFWKANKWSPSFLKWVCSWQTHIARNRELTWMHLFQLNPQHSVPTLEDHGLILIER